MDGAGLFAPDRIRGLLDEGRALLGAGRPHDALLAFERAALCAPGSEEVRGGLEDARAALAEAERVAEEGLAAADALLHEGRTAEARAILVPLAGGLRGAEALARLDRLAPGEALFATERTSEGADVPRAFAFRRGSRARKAFAAACVSSFVALGAGIAAGWDEILDGLRRTPSPRSVGGPTVAGETGPADPTSRARRLVAAGHPAAALAVLDAVPPEDPAWPLARQLRGQVQEMMLRGGRETAVRR